MLILFFTIHYKYLTLSSIATHLNSCSRIFHIYKKSLWLIDFPILCQFNKNRKIADCTISAPPLYVNDKSIQQLIFNFLSTFLRFKHAAAKTRHQTRFHVRSLLQFFRVICATRQTERIHLHTSSHDRPFRIPTPLIQTCDSIENAHVFASKQQREWERCALFAQQ